MKFSSKTVLLVAMVAILVVEEVLSKEFPISNNNQLAHGIIFKLLCNKNHLSTKMICDLIALEFNQ